MTSLSLPERNKKQLFVSYKKQFRHHNESRGVGLVYMDVYEAFLE